MCLKRRIDALERARAGSGKKRYLIWRQDLHDETLYRDAAGNEYRQGSPSWPDDDDNLILILINYDIYPKVPEDAPGDFNMLPANWENGKPPTEIPYPS